MCFDIERVGSIQHLLDDLSKVILPVCTAVVDAERKH